MNNDPELLKIKTKDDGIGDLKYETGKDDHENKLKSLKIDHEFYKKKSKSLKKKVLLIIGSASTVCSSTMGLINPGVGIFISNCTALLSSTVILITNEYISKLKIRYTKLQDWINVRTLFCEETLKTSMVDKSIDETEAEELKNIYNY